MQRRYDLDWLRVIAFALLMLFHTGMMFSTWDWHIKNLETSPSFDLIMRFLHQWRMPLLFFISGSAVWFAMDRYSTWRYFLERQKRLLLPLVFGMLVVIPPQVYVERLFNHQQFDSFPDFYRTIFTTGSYPQGNLSWHHLWYIPYIWTFSMLTLPLFLFLRSEAGRRLMAWTCRKLQNPWCLVLILVPAAGSDLLVRPFFPEDRMNLISDWGNFCHKLTFFMTGFVLASAPAVYDVIARQRRRFLVAGLLSLIPVEAIWLGYWRLASAWAYWLLVNVNIWMWLLIVLGYGRHYLSFNHAALRYANEAVYPFYILHQTVIVLLGYQFVYGQWSIPAKFLVVVAGTFSLTWLIYEFFIKRFNVLRVAFGMKPQRARSPQRAGSGARNEVAPVPTATEPQPAQAVPGSREAPILSKAFSPARLTMVLVVMAAAAVIVSACSRGKGRLICRTIDAPSLATNIMGIFSRQEVVVFLPPTYDRNTGRYPVLYLLPNFKHNLWRYTGGSFQGFRLKDALNDQMRKSGNGREMIVVLPNANHWLGGSWYRNSPLAGNWEDYVVRDLVDYVDSHFRTIPQASSRALAGHGMGGIGSLELGLTHPDVFGSVYAMSPALFDPNGLRDSGVLSQKMLAQWQSNLQRWNRLAPPEAAKREFRDFLQTRLNSPDRSLFMEGLSVSYAAAVSVDLSLPYPHILFPAMATESDRAVVPRFENGFGGWPEKLANYRAKGQPLAAITIEYGGPGEYDWIRNGSEYLSKQMRSMGIPNTLAVHRGGHESALRQRLESGMLPSVARTLKGENE